MVRSRGPNRGWKYQWMNPMKVDEKEVWLLWIS